MGRSLRFVLVSISVLLVLSGCQLLGHAFSFENSSSHSLHISPDGQSWAAFTLSAGQTKDVNIPETTITFMYDNADLVDCDTTSRAGTITFTDVPTVTYSVTGSSTNVFIYYTNATGGNDSLNVTSLPWSYAFAAHRGTFVYLEAFDNDGTGTTNVTVTINENGSILQTSTSSYDATASGTL